MKESKKSYLLNLTKFESAFVDEMAWENRQRLSEYFRELIEAEMQKRPDVVEKLKGVQINNGTNVG